MRASSTRTMTLYISRMSISVRCLLPPSAPAYGCFRNRWHFLVLCGWWCYAWLARYTWLRRPAWKSTEGGTMVVSKLTMHRRWRAAMHRKTLPRCPLARRRFQSWWWWWRKRFCRWRPKKTSWLVPRSRRAFFNGLWIVGSLRPLFLASSTKQLTRDGALLHQLAISDLRSMKLLNCFNRFADLLQLHVGNTTRRPTHEID